MIYTAYVFFCMNQYEHNHSKRAAHDRHTAPKTARLGCDIVALPSPNGVHLVKYVLPFQVSVLTFIRGVHTGTKQYCR